MLIAAQIRRTGFTNMETEEVASEVPAETTTEVKDTNAEENKEPVPAEPASEVEDANAEENKEPVPAELISEVKDDNAGENKEPEPAEPTSEVKDANTEENKEPTTSTDIQDHVTDKNKEGAVTEMEVESSKDDDKPPCDWLEPLEEDCEDADSQSVDGEVESLAGSEWSGSVVSVLKSTGERVGRGGGYVHDLDFSSHQTFFLLKVLSSYALHYIV